MTAEDEDALWLTLEVIGRRSGHVVCRCPACHQRQMAAYRPQSAPWPHCRVCTSQARLEPVSDPSLVTNKRRGRLPGTAALLAAGYIVRPPALRDSAVEP